MLNEKQLQAIDLLAQGVMPLHKIAESLEIAERTLYNWRQDHEFQRSLSDRGQDTVEAMLFKRIVTTQDPAAIKLWYQIKGVLNDDSEDALNEVLALSDSDRIEIAQDIYSFVVAHPQEFFAEGLPAGDLGDPQSPLGL